MVCNKFIFSYFDLPAWGVRMKLRAAGDMQVHHDSFEGVGRWKAEQMTLGNSFTLNNNNQG